MLGVDRLIELRSGADVRARRKHTSLRRSLWFLLSVPALAGATDWPSYGNDPGSSKYAPLDQIHAGNVDKLQIAWIWESPDNAMVRADRKLTPIGFKSTPIKIGDTLYISTSLGHVAALEPGSGKQKWLFDTETYPVSYTDLRAHET